MADTTALRKKKETTTVTDLARLVPKSETQWRGIASRAHRIRKFPGDEAAARTHELMIYEIRTNAAAGSSRTPRFCPRCLEKGNKYMLIYMGGMDCCGTCYWPRTSSTWETPEATPHPNAEGTPPEPPPQK